MLVVDSHLDLSWNALGWNRDLTLPVAEVRAAESGMTGKARGRGTVTLPELRRGQVGICFATLLAHASATGTGPLDYRTQGTACAMARGQLAWYRILAEQGECEFIRDAAALQRCAEAWKAGTGGLGFVIAMEGADPILSPAQMPEWWADGLRVIGLTHYGKGVYADGTGAAGGLTARGRELLRAMEECGMMLDLTHLSDRAFDEALGVFGGPVLASHNNCRALTPGDRQFSDAQIRAIVERGGVIGAAFDAWMLVPGWSPEEPNRATLRNVVEHIDYVCQLAGDARHAAIGSDLDGGFGIEQGPADLDTIADVQKIAELLRERGYAEGNIANIMHGNWLRCLTAAWA